MTVREGISEPKSRCPATYRYQNPKSHFILRLLLGLLCSTGCLRHRRRDMVGIADCKSHSCSHSSLEEVGPHHWDSSRRVLGAKGYSSCSAVAQSQPPPLPRDEPFPPQNTQQEQSPEEPGTFKPSPSPSKAGCWSLLRYQSRRTGTGCSLECDEVSELCPDVVVSQSGTETGS